MPPPRGKAVQINMFVDSAHATCLATRRSTTGIIFFLNSSPVIWHSRRQNTIEGATFGSEFVALRTAVDMNEALRYKLRMFGIPIEGPTNGFCDNEGVVKNVSRPESTLQKKHNSIAYHRCRYAIASSALRVTHEPGKSNLADLLTKFLPATTHHYYCKHLFYWGNETKATIGGMPLGGLLYSRVISLDLRLVALRSTRDAQYLVTRYGGFWRQLVDN